MNMETLTIYHLVKRTNHHGTLFAGRGAEWLVEAVYCCKSATAAVYSVLLQNQVWSLPASALGRDDTNELNCGVAETATLISYVRAEVKELAMNGFITFVYVDEAGKSRPHGIVIEAHSPEEIALQERAKAL